MALLAAQLAVDVILIAAGYEEYSTAGIFMGAIEQRQAEAEAKKRNPLIKHSPFLIKNAADFIMGRKPPKIKAFSEYTKEEQAELLKKSSEEAAYLREEANPQLTAYLEQNALRLALEKAKREAADSSKFLKRREVAIAALPTSNDLNMADNARRSLLSISTKPPPPQDDLADSKARLQKLNDEARMRTLAQETRLKETMENAEEQRARNAARQAESKGQLDFLLQRQQRAAEDIAKIQQIGSQQRASMQAALASTTNATAALRKAEEEQRAKAAAQQVLQVPNRSRLPPSVKIGGAKMNLLKRIMAETNMSKKDALRYINFYGF